MSLTSPSYSTDATTPRRARRRTRARTFGAALGSLLAAVLLAAPATADAPAASPRAAAFEVPFMEEMIDHHQMGVHMSEMCLDKADHEELAGLCEMIISSQAAEIEQMQGWLFDWYGIDHEPMMDDPHHHHQMMQLAELSGAQFEIAFLQMMSEHHVMAVDEGLQCIRSAEHGELRDLCRDIVVIQLREIAQMESWLCRWYGDCRFTYLRSATG